MKGRIGDDIRVRPIKIPGPTTRSVASRIIAVAVLPVMILLFWTAIIAPWQDWQKDNAERIADLLATISKLQATIALDKPDIPVTNEAEDREISASFLSGPEDSLIMADLQTKLRDLVEKHHAQISSTRILPPKSTGGIAYLGLKIDLRGNLRDVHRIIYDIEAFEPFLFIEKAHLRLNEQQLLAKPAPQQSPSLLAELDILGAKKPVAVAAKPSEAQR